MLPKEDRKAMLLRLYNDDSPLMDHSKDRFAADGSPSPMLQPPPQSQPQPSPHEAAAETAAETTALGHYPVGINTATATTTTPSKTLQTDDHVMAVEENDDDDDDDDDDEEGGVKLASEEGIMDVFGGED